MSAQLNIIAEDSHDRGRCDCCGCSSRAVSGWIEEQDVEGRGAARYHSTTPAEAPDGGVPGRAVNDYCYLRKEIKL